MTDLSLRPFRPEDASAFHDAVIESVSDLEPWMPWCHPGYTIEEARAWTELQAKQFASGTEFEFLIFTGNALVGAVGVNQIDARNRRGNIGYWVRSSATRKGYATAAVNTVTRWAAANTDLQRLEILVAAGNVASLRVAEKSCAVREAVLQQRLLLHGSFHDAILFAIVRGRNMPLQSRP